MSQPSRRALLRAGLVVPATALLAGGTAAATTTRLPEATVGGLRRLETTYDVRLGVYARNLVTGRAMLHRAGERFAICSVFKTFAVAAVLRDLDRDGEVLARRIRYSSDDLVVNSPITSQHVDTGMTVRELSDAALRYSDNTAGNLLLRLIGGPAGITRFARSIGDRRTRLDRWEPELNTSLPHDPRDTSTPAAVAASYLDLLLGTALSRSDSALLRTWMLANQTSNARFRAGLPADWRLADKTGAGDYGSLNDAGIAWKPDGTPIVLVALSVKSTPGATADNALLADVARLASHL